MWDSRVDPKWLRKSVCMHMALEELAKAATDVSLPATPN